MYVNPGYLALVNDYDCEEVKNETYNPTNNVALKGEFYLETSLSPVDFYCKFDFYKDSNDINLEYTGLKGYAGKLIFQADDLCFKYAYSSDYFNKGWAEYKIPKDVVKDNEINKIWIHINRGHLNQDSSSNYYLWWVDGKVELKINDYEISESTDKNISNVTMNDINNRYFDFYSNCPISNIIISDDPIDKDEKVIELPISATDTDMTQQSTGNYIATIEDQYLLQKVDAKTLVAKFGGKSEVKNIFVVGAPAYKTTDGLSTITSIEKSEGKITEYDSATLLDEADYAYIMLRHKVESMTMRDFEGKSYGFKLGV